MLRTAFACFLFAIAAGAAAPVAASGAGWSPPLPLPSTWGLPSIGFDGSGIATVAHVETVSTTPVVTRIGISTRRSDGAWDEQFSLASAPGFVPVSVKVAVGRNGAAAACMDALTTTDIATAQWLRAVSYRAAGSASWETPLQVGSPEAPTTATTECEPKVTPTGFAAVLTGHELAGFSALQLVTRTPAGSWTAPQGINVGGQPAKLGQLGLDDAGNATIVWVHRWQVSPERISIRVRTRSASTGVLGLSSPLTPESGTGSVSAPQLAVNAAGQGVVAMQYQLHLHATSRATASGAWDPLTPMFTDATASSSSPRAVGIGPSGQAHVLYWRQGPVSSDNSVVGAVRRNVNFGPWSGHAALSPADADGRNGAVAYVGDAAFLAFSAAIGGGGGDPGTGILQASTWPSFSAIPDLGTDLVAPGPISYLDAALADNAGSLAVIHHNYAGGLATPRYLLSAYDASAPVLTGSSVPSSVVLGEPAQLRATFADLYSPISSVSWDFGDGTPKGAGPTVTHAWAAAGPYAVTATARDTAGNEATQSFMLTAAPAAQPPVPVPQQGDGVRVTDTVRPVIAVDQPRCKKKQKRSACTAMRKKTSSWKTVRGTASDNTALVRVHVVAIRKKAKKVKAKTIRRTATLRGASWSARLNGLTKGKWTITATATDAAGNATSARRTVSLR